MRQIQLRIHMISTNLYCLVNVNSGNDFFIGNRSDAISYELDCPDFICIHSFVSNDSLLNTVRSSTLPLHS